MLSANTDNYTCSTEKSRERDILGYKSINTGIVVQPVLLNIGLLAVILEKGTWVVPMKNNQNHVGFD